MGAKKKNKRKQAKAARKLARRQRQILRDLRSNRRRREKLAKRTDKERAVLDKLLVRGDEAGLAVEDLAEEAGIDPVQADQVLEINEDSSGESVPVDEPDADQPGKEVVAADGIGDATDGGDASATDVEIGEPVTTNEVAPPGGENVGALDVSADKPAA